MSKAPAFQLYAADFYMDTLTWDADDIGVYFCLLMAEWVNGPLENDTRKLAKIAKKTHQKFIKNWLKISQKFYETGTGTIINLRLEDERKKQDKYSESQRDRVNKRWIKDDTHVDTTVLPAQIPTGYSSSSISSSKDNKEFYKEGEEPVDNSKSESLEKPQNHGERWEGTQAQTEITELMEEILNRYGQQTYHQCYLFIQEHFNKKNPSAIVYCLKSFIERKKEREPVKVVKAWLDKALADQDGKHNAREHEAKSKEFKKPIDQGGMEAIGKILSGISRGSPGG